MRNGISAGLNASVNRNSSRQYAPAIVRDLVTIGCSKIADITQQALDALDLPELSVTAIEAAMKAESSARDRTLERCNIAFYEPAELSGNNSFRT